MNEGEVINMISSGKMKLPAGVYTRFLKDGEDIELAIIIDDDTTFEKLKKAWPRIAGQRERLRRQQGTDLGKFRNHLRYRYAYMWLREGYSYAEVAMEINYDCLKNLCSASEKASANLIPGARESYRAAWGLLDSVGMKETDIQGWLQTGLEAIQRGEAPWSLTDGPVKKQRVVDTLRQLNREVEDGKFVIGRKPKTKLLPVDELLRANKATRDRVEALLRQLPNSGGLDRLSSAHKRHDDSSDLIPDRSGGARVRVIAYRG